MTRPRSAIHWMTPPESATTRIVTDTTDAQVLVGRGTEAASLADIPAAGPAPLRSGDERARYTGCGRRVLIWIDVPETGEMPTELQFKFDDTNRRRFTLSLPLQSRVAALLRAVAREGSASGM